MHDKACMNHNFLWVTKDLKTDLNCDPLVKFQVWKEGTVYVDTICSNSRGYEDLLPAVFLLLFLAAFRSTSLTPFVTT